MKHKYEYATDKIYNFSGNEGNKYRPHCYKPKISLKTKKFYPWLVVALLWVVALLNYMDHQMLSTMQEG